MPQLETTRLMLREFTLEDVDAYYHQVFSDPDVMRYLSSRVPRPREQIEEAMPRIVGQWASEGLGRLAVIYKADRCLIGHCALLPLDGTSEVEVAYALGKAYWGQGLATEAARVCLQYGFDQLKLSHIVEIAMPENSASRHVLEKLGMRYEGAKHYYGIDVARYSITREKSMKLKDES